MKLSLHPVIIGQSLSLQEFVRLAAETGYQGVDVDASSLAKMAEERGADAVQAIFAEAGVEPAGWGLPLDWRRDAESFQAGLSALSRTAELMAAIGCPRTFTYIPPSTDGDPAEYRQLLVSRLGAVARVLENSGVRIGLEWLGPRHIRASGTPVIWKMSHTLDLIDDIGLDNVGLLLDVWHWFNAEDTIDELRHLRAEQIVHCHFNDAPDRPLDEQRDMEREIPGRGIIPLVDVLRALRDTGYAGFLAVEIFNDGLKKMEPREAALLVKQACAEILARI
ncbi:MAG: sugar phosphate isomerase/epimerase [Armatimonadetes bacterium]|nr:sugar phosphate isomerase/epimerase [Armatimonadota bacterium]